MKDGRLKTLTNGILRENPVLVLLLGLCPTLATTTSASNGFGMGISTMAVLICSNMVIALLKDLIPNKVRVPAYIVVIAGFVTIVQLLLKAYLPALDASLGLYIPLIVVNCIIFGRAEMYASKNSVVNSALDGIGMGVGFTLALTTIGLIRELLGSGTFFGLAVAGASHTPMMIFMLAPGGFFVLAIIIATINWLTKGQAIRKKEIGCDGCSMIDVCGGYCDREEGRN
jgi:electron transport complex protein RnfE